MEAGMKKGFAILGLVLTAVLIASPDLFAEKKIRLKKAPSFAREGVWLNGAPAGRKVFDHKITLVWFWDYTAINCLRELRYLKSWYEHYHPYGLEVIFVHAPEFEFAKKEENLKGAVERLGVPFPIYLDNDFKLWEGYGVQAWPTRYLVNDGGRIVMSKSGEGDYMQMEQAIRDALKAIHPAAVLPDFVREKERERFDLDQCGDMSPETYTGYKKRNDLWGAEIADATGIVPDQTRVYLDRGKRVEHGFFVQGKWTNRAEAFEHARETPDYTDYLGVLYLASEVYVVMDSEERGTDGVKVYVTRDEAPVPQYLRGPDVHEDDHGATYILFKEPRLYYLISNENEEPHEIKLWAGKKGVDIHSFSFANRCLNDFDHV